MNVRSPFVWSVCIFCAAVILTVGPAAAQLRWQLHQPDPVLDVGQPGSWDAWTVDTPAVVLVDGTYYLFYYGQSTSATSDSSSIGVATSDDGLVFERERETPVIAPGPAGAWDERWVESPTVHFDRESGLWRMWYSGVGADWVAQIGLATSTDGIHWDKFPGNPVLGVGAPGTWDDYWVAVPDVIRWRPGYWMFYCGVSADDLADGRADRPAVGFAWSVDGIRWHRGPADPVLSADDLSSGAPWAPAVVVGDTRRRLDMWFETSAGFLFARGVVIGRRELRSHH